MSKYKDYKATAKQLLADLQVCYSTLLATAEVLNDMTAFLLLSKGSEDLSCVNRAYKALAQVKLIMPKLPITDFIAHNVNLHLEELRHAQTPIPPVPEEVKENPFAEGFAKLSGELERIKQEIKELKTAKPDAPKKGRRPRKGG